MTSAMGTTSAAGIAWSRYVAIDRGEFAAGIWPDNAAQARPSRPDSGSSAGTASTSVSRAGSAHGPLTANRVAESLVHSRSAKNVDTKTSPATASKINPPTAVVEVAPAGGPNPLVTRPSRLGFRPSSVLLVDAKDTGGVSAKGSLPSRVLLSCIFGSRPHMHRHQAYQYCNMTAEAKTNV